MMSPIGLYLAEFTPRTALPAVSGSGFPRPRIPDHEDLLAVDAEAVQLEQARGEAFAAGVASAEALVAIRAAALESRHAEHLAAERQRWAEAQGATLAKSLEDGLAQLEHKLANALAEILEPFVRASLRTKAVAELRDALETLLANGTGAAITVSGPADIVESLRTAFAGKATLNVLAADSPEVTVLAGDTVIRSQLQAWASGLKLGVPEGP